MTNNDVTRHNPAPWRTEGNLILDAEGKPVAGLVVKRMHSESEFMILDAINNRPPLEPTMGQWDDFCAVHYVPFDKFILAYKAMFKAKS